MKKLLFIALVITVLNNAKAQDPANCNCTVVISPLITKVANICDFHYQVFPNDPVIAHPAVYIVVRYWEKVCGNVIVYDIYDILIHDSWIANYNEAQQGNFHSYDASSACTEIPITQAIIDKYVDILVPKTTSTGRFIRYSGGCRSMAKMEFPANAVYYLPNDAGGYTAYPLGDGGNTYMPLSCNDICCIMELDNNGTITRRPVQESDCSSQEPPSPTPQAVTSTNPTTGLPETYYGVVVSQTDCEHMCSTGGPNWMLLAPVYQTDGGELGKDYDLELSANPTLVHDLIKFTSKIPLKHADIYDVQGRKIKQKEIQDNELRAGDLKTGIYYIQVHFESGDVKTIKIYKE